MFGLIYKDILTKRKSFILFAVMLVVSAALILSFPLVFAINADGGITAENSLEEHIKMVMGIYLMLYIVADSVSGMLFGHDENTAWSSYVISSPIGARGQIKEKYILILLLFGIVTHHCIILESILAIMTGSESGSISSLFIILFYLFLLMRAAVLPFTVRFGSRYGNNISSFILLVIIFCIGVYFLFGDISSFGSVDDFFKKLADIIAGNTQSDLLIISSSLLPVISIAAYYISYRISCKLYCKGAENYEQ